MEPLLEYCAPGATSREEYFSIAGHIQLRIIRFLPPVKKNHPTVLFVPGWITLIEAWKSVLRAMSAEFPILYVETREKISSRVKGKIGYGIQAIGSDLVEIITRAGLKSNQYLLFGSSLGATVILDCNRTLPFPPLGQILVAPNAVFRVPGWGMIIIRIFYPGFYSVIKPVVKWYLKNFRLDVNADPAQYEKYCRNLDAADPWKLKKAVLEFARYEVWDNLPNIKLPTLIVSASRDKLHEPENIQKMLAMMPNAHFVDLGTNQNTHSERVVEEIFKFLVQLSNFSCRCTTCNSFRNV